MSLCPDASLELMHLPEASIRAHQNVRGADFSKFKVRLFSAWRKKGGHWDFRMSAPRTFRVTAYEVLGRSISFADASSIFRYGNYPQVPYHSFVF